LIKAVIKSNWDAENDPRCSFSRAVAELFTRYLVLTPTTPNMAITPLMLVGNKADSRDIDPVAILAYTRADALSRHEPHRRKGSRMNAYRGLGPISMLLVLMIGTVSVAGEGVCSGYV
jgi:hypothetical protein